MRPNKIFIILNLISILSFGQWTQIGNTILGENYSNHFGKNCMNADGTIIAISESGGTNLKIYKYNTNSWTQLGNTINIVVNSFSLSNDGHTIVIGLTGLVKVYNYNSGVWNNVFSINTEEDSGTILNNSVSINGEGNIIAIGVPRHDAGSYDKGHVLIYENTNDIWGQKGQILEGSINFDEFGYSISLSNNGDTLAVGVPNYDGGTGDDYDNRGKIEIFEFKDSSWQQVGSEIEGYNPSDRLGKSIDISFDGKTVSASTYYDNIRYVAIFNFIHFHWVQKGSAIFGETISEHFAATHSLSSDGNIVAIGSLYSNEEGIHTGHSCIYKFDSGSWSQIGENISGENNYDHAGLVSLSANGEIVAVGSPENDGYSTNSDNDNGCVRVYKFTTGINAIQTSSNISLFPNPTNNYIVIGNSSTRVTHYNIFDISGKLIISSSNYSYPDKIVVRNLINGIYFIKIKTHETSYTQKFIIIK